MNEDSKQQQKQKQNIPQDTDKTQQKQQRGYGDKKLKGPDFPST
jgi:hypothetical protein